MTPGKGGDDKDNPLHFSGEIKDWPTFKEAIQCHADARDTTWLLEAGRALALFFARQIKDKTCSAATRKKALDRKSRRTAITYQSRSMRTTMALSRNGSMTGTSLQTCSCPSTRTACRQWGQISAITPSWGSKMQRRWRRRTRSSTSSTSDRQTEWRCGSFTTLFLSIRQRRRPHVTTTNKLHSILQNNEVSKILRGAVDDADD
jgi:hypothetical protein